MLEELTGVASRLYKENRYDNDLGMRKLRKALRVNYGIALDIRQYVANAYSVRALSKTYSIPVATYTINGQPYHSKSLIQLPPQLRPDSVIIDDTIYGFCTQYHMPDMQTYQPSSPLGRALAALPADLDLERLAEIEIYAPNGLYPALNGTLKSIDGSVSSNRFIPVLLDVKAGPKEKDTTVELETNKAIKVELRKKDNEPGS